VFLFQNEDLVTFVDFVLLIYLMESKMSNFLAYLVSNVKI
jgi:hypothetical protein